MRMRGWLVGLCAVASTLTLGGCGGDGGGKPSAATPTGITAGAEEVMGVQSGLRSSITVDAAGQPHAVSDSGLVSGPEVFFFDKVGGVWSEQTFNVQSRLNPATDWLFGPHIEIDSAGRAWTTATMVTPGDGGEPACGAAILVRENVATDAGAAIHASQNTVWESPWTWGQALSSLDPALPEECIVMSVNAFWSRFTYNASASSRVRQGGVNAVPAIQGGEKMGFAISKAGSVVHTDGSHAVWHVAGHGFSKWDSGYQNTLRIDKGLEPIKFAAVSRYPVLGDDYTWPGVCGDNLNPEIAYISSDYTDWRNGGTLGVQLNVYDPEKDAMIFPASANLLLDANGTSGTQRYPPAMAAARNGGVFIAWTSANRINIQFVGSDGEVGVKADVAAGTCPAICVDQSGNIHLAYQNGNMRYRLLTVQY